MYIYQEVITLWYIYIYFLYLYLYIFIYMDILDYWLIIISRSNYSYTYIYIYIYMFIYMYGYFRLLTYYYFICCRPAIKSIRLINIGLPYLHCRLLGLHSQLKTTFPRVDRQIEKEWVIERDERIAVGPLTNLGFCVRNKK